MKQTIKLLSLIGIIVIFSGCSATWEGLKKDTSKNWEATKDMAKETYKAGKDAMK